MSHPMRTTWRAIGVLPAMLAVACRTEPPAAIVVEADTTAVVVSGSARPVVEPAPAPQAPEVVVIEERVVAPASEPDAPPAPARSEGLADAEPAEPGVAGDPEPPRSGTYVLPAGTRLVLELRTPLHSGTSRVGDRFAVRTVEPVVLGESVALEPGSLVEGRIAGVVRSGEAGDPGRIELDFRDLVLPDGRRVPLEAEIASVAGREAEVAARPPAAAIAGSAAGGAVLGGAVGGARGAAIGAVIGAVGATLVASARDHEVVVPSGTRMEIVLTTPLEIH
jgi:type IV secretion system protein VirB10